MIYRVIFKAIWFPLAIWEFPMKANRGKTNRGAAWFSRSRTNKNFTKTSKKCIFKLLSAYLRIQIFATNFFSLLFSCTKHVYLVWTLALVPSPLWDIVPPLSGHQLRSFLPHETLLLHFCTKSIHSASGRRGFPVAPATLAITIFFIQKCFSSPISKPLREKMVAIFCVIQQGVGLDVGLRVFGILTV